MTPYRIKITETAKKEIRRLLGHVRQRARRIVISLGDDPRPPAAKELRGLPGRYRLRLNGWRIIYRVEDEVQSVTILRIRQKAGPETYQQIA